MAQTTVLRPRALTGPVITEGDGTVFTFDAGFSESPTDEAEVTRHPVEDGADITDHVQDLPARLSLVVGLTNSPLPEQGPMAKNRDLDLYLELLDVKRRGELLQVVTGLRVYDNMVLTRVAPTRTARSGQALEINIDFEEVKLTTTETVDIPPAQQRRRAGRQNPEAVAKAATAEQINVGLAGAGATESGEGAAAGGAATQTSITVAAATTGPKEGPEETKAREKDTRDLNHLVP